MADEQGSIWPLPKFYFSVDIGDFATNIPFQEVTGLDNEPEVITYRARTSQGFETIKMPGIINTGNVTLKKGVFVNDNKFFGWYSQIRMNMAKREAVTIRLLDTRGNPTVVWTLANSWPTKITGADLKSDGNEVAVETIEFAHEGLTIANG